MDAIDPGLARRLLDVAVDIAREAGEMLAGAVYETRARVETKSTSTDMVTEMDGASEQLILERLHARRPDDAVVGEEGGERAGTTGVRWLVDPLDGTTNYLYRYPGWNVSIGAEIDGISVAGAVSVPAFGELFAGASGLGATRNGEPISAGTPAALDHALVGTGFGYDREVRARQGELVALLLPRVRDVRRMGAAAVDLCSVACGRLDAYFEAGLAPWDLCAGEVIAREAGVRVESFDDAISTGPLVVATAADLWDDLLAALAELGALGSRHSPGEP